MTSAVAGRRTQVTPARRVASSPVARRAATIVAVCVAVLLAWDLALQVEGVPAYEVPSPWTTLRAIGSNAGPLSRHLWVTVQGAGLGLLLACALAALLGTVAVRWPALERVLVAYAVVVRTIPLVGIAPTITLAFGRGLATSVVCVAVVSTFPLLISVLGGQRALPPELRELFGVYESSFAARARYGLLPAALSSILVGLRTAAPFAVLGALLAEWLTGIDGLGNLMVTAAANRTIPLLWAGALVTAVFGLIVYAAVGLAERAAQRAGLDIE